jgi:DNA-binding response OmpR family regulator
VLSDVVMPHMNGGELAQRLRQHDPAVNVLFVSCEVPEAPRIEGLDRPGFLPKPFRAETLLRAVADALRRSQKSEVSCARGKKCL